MKFKGGGTVESREALQESLDKSSGDNFTIWVRQIPSDGEIQVRFLTDPEGNWFEYREHWGQSVKSYYACVGKDENCPGCLSDSEQDKRTSKRYLVNVLDVEAGRVIPLKLPVDLVNRLQTRLDRNGTLTDRDYILSRTGKGLNTIYDLDPQDKDSLDVDRYKSDLHDLEKVLIDQWNDAWNSDKKDKSTKATTEVAGTPVDNESDEDQEVVLTEDDIRNMDRDELEEVAQELNIPAYDEMSRGDLISAILDSADRLDDDGNLNPSAAGEAPAADTDEDADADDDE